MYANRKVAPFVRHNAFSRWSALQDTALGGGDVNSSASTPGANRAQVKIWSKDNVSEDFNMALRLVRQGYIVRFVLFLLELSPSRECMMRRWATYSKGGFKEGVSLTVDDELNSILSNEPEVNTENGNFA